MDQHTGRVKGDIFYFCGNIPIFRLNYCESKYCIVVYLYL